MGRLRRVWRFGEPSGPPLGGAKRVDSWASAPDSDSVAMTKVTPTQPLVMIDFIRATNY